MADENLRLIAERLKELNKLFGPPLEKRYADCNSAGAHLNLNGKAYCEHCYRTREVTQRGDQNILSYWFGRGIEYISLMFNKEKRFSKDIAEFPDWMRGLEGMLAEATLDYVQSQQASSALPRDQDRQFHT